MIRFEDVFKKNKRGDFYLKGVSFRVDEGEFVYIHGPSGSGKTSILRLLLAEDKPDRGTVLFYGVNIHNLKKSDIPRYRQKIGTVFQDFRLIQEKTVYENVAFVMEMLGASEDDIQEDTMKALEIVSLLDKKDFFPKDLSGGEQQRLAIARAMVNQPDVLIADEPSSLLDTKHTTITLDILKKINELGTTVILLTHEKKIPIAHAREIALHHGKIIHDSKVLKDKENEVKV